MMAIAVVMVMLMIMVISHEEIGLDVEDAVEIEGAALEHVGERDVALLRPMQRRVGVDRADARLDLAQLRRADEIDLVEHDHDHEHEHEHHHDHHGLKHYHDEDIQSISARCAGDLDPNKFMPWINQLTQEHGPNILRSKGIVAMKGDPKRFVFQGVHMMLDGDSQREWRPDEKRESKVVFIGRDLAEDDIRRGFLACAA